MSPVVYGNCVGAVTASPQVAGVADVVMVRSPLATPTASVVLQAFSSCEAGPRRWTTVQAEPSELPEKSSKNTVLALAPVVALKSTPVTLALLRLTWRLEGVKVSAALLGVMVKDPLARPEKLKLPEASVVVEVLAAPLRVTLTPAPTEAGPMVPAMVKLPFEA